MTSLLGSALALVGTFIQFYVSIQQLDRLERDTFRVIDDWRHEVSWRHPIRRRRHRSVVARLLADSPDEAAAFHRVERLLLSWSILVIAAGLFLIQALNNIG